MRVPQQTRSRALVARILDAAAELFANTGYEATTTNHIATSAGVSVGSLYQFFADKHAVLEALQADWTVRLGDALDADLRANDTRSVTEIVDSVLDIHATVGREQPGLLGVLLTTHAGSRQVTSVRDTVQARLDEVLASKVPTLTVGRRRVAAAMLIHLSLGLYSLPRSVADDQDAVRAEVRAALIAYIESLSR